MRLSDKERLALRKMTKELVGDKTVVRVFGSRLDDTAKGGDLDLLLKMEEPVERPAWLVARVTAAASDLLGGMPVDVVLSAPNLRRLPIHDVALRDGVPL